MAPSSSLTDQQLIRPLVDELYASPSHQTPIHLFSLFSDGLCRAYEVEERVRFSPLTEERLLEPSSREVELVSFREKDIRRFFYEIQAAEDSYATETRAAADIQRIFRGAICRFQYERVVNGGEFLEVRRAVEAIQRVYRGHVGRCKVKALRTRERGEQQLAFFNAQAETIQRVFKGFWSRRYLHDYYAMKRYLLEVAERGERSRSYLQERADARSKAQEEENARGQESAIRKILSECGHLCPGVYNPPYAKALPHVLGEPVETQIRKYAKPKVVKSIRRPKPFEKSPQRRAKVTPKRPVAEDLAGDPATDLAYQKFLLSTVTANVGRQQPIQGPFRSKEQIALSNTRAENNFSSLSSSVCYDKVEKEIRMQNKISKLTRKGPGFRVMKPHVLRYGPTVQSDSLYSAPAEFRSDYTELPRLPGKTKFYTALESGKSFQDYTTEFDSQKGASSVPVLPRLDPSK